MSRAKDLAKKLSSRLRRKKRVRAKIVGTSDVPRLTIFKSNRYISVQVIYDSKGFTLASINSKSMNLTINKNNAIKISEKFSEILKSKDITNMVFDRNGYLYHGVIASFAQGLRDNGIKV